MIQVEAILVEDFRGIRRLDLQPGCKSFMVWGPNGSGKSGVVDAIDFALTGTIGRLSGTGTGAVSVLRHGPHVLQRNNAEAARVSLTIRDMVSGQTGVLTRCVKTAAAFTLTPDTPQLRAAVEQARQHPELTLSRREIIKYILTEPGARAQAIQALLKLDRIDQVRKLLVAARNKAVAESSVTIREIETAQASMSRHLGLTGSPVSSEVSRMVNQARVVLGLQPIDKLTADSDLRVGVETAAGSTAFNKASATRDVQALAIGIANPDRIRATAAQLTATLNELSDDPTILSALRHRALVTMGLDLLSEAICPLCDLRWDDIKDLRTHLQEKLVRSEAAADLERRILGSAAALRSEIRSLTDLVQSAQPWASSDGDRELSHRLRSWSQDLTELSGKLQTVDGAAAELPRISGDILSVPADINGGLTALQLTLEAKPDQSATESARTFLIVAQERWTRARLAEAAHKKAVSTQNTANLAYDTYCMVTDEALTHLYRTVESDFSGYYRQINADDESSFTAKLEPSAGKLEFKVDFYGIDMFPPRRVSQ